jgi:hypothetical protein
LLEAVESQEISESIMMKKSTFVVVALTGWLLVGAAVAAPQFVQGPTARYAAAMAYDSVREVVVLFGGNSSGQWPAGALGDTWEWNGSAWNQRTSGTSPSPRAHGAMTYDSARGVTVFFGGYNGSTLGETWEWVSGWTSLCCASSSISLVSRATCSVASSTLRRYSRRTRFNAS